MIHLVFLYGLISCFLGALGGWSVASFGAPVGLLDYPNERSSHQVPTPKGGGIGILTAFTSVTLLEGISVTFWAPVSVVALVGLYGDMKHVSPCWRLILQFGSAVIFLLGMTSGIPNTMNSLLWFLAMSLFLVGTANFYNFMDGINGLAAITGTVGFGLLTFFAYFSGADASVVILTMCLTLACLGFLPFNWPHAKVFMGDVGSILLGFVFAGVVISLSKNMLDFVCLTTFLLPFYADELTTMIVRIRDGESLIRPHRRHLYQLLVNEYGMPHWKVSTIYGSVQLLVGVSVLSVRHYGLLSVLLLLAVYWGGCISVTWIARSKLHLRQ